MYRRMLRRDIFCKNPEAKLRGTVDFLFGDCIHCITTYIKTEFSKFRDFIHEQVFDAVELYLEWTDGDVAGCGGVDSERLAARTH